MTTPETTAEWVNANELARRLSVHVSTIWRLVNDEGMPSVKLSTGKSGARRFNVVEVEAWLRDRGETPA